MLTPRHTAVPPSIDRAASPLQPRSPVTDPFPASDAALHDIANLLDASLRAVTTSRRAADPARAIDALEAALIQIADLFTAVIPQRPSNGIASLARAGSFVPIPRMLEDAIVLMRPLADDHGAEIHFSCDAALSAYAAPGLYRVVTDAIRNSLDSLCATSCLGTPPTTTGIGSILVSARIIPAETCEAPATLRLVITDDGIGPPQSLGEPFAPGASTKPGSTGLGLAVARHIVRSLRGAVTLASAGLSFPGRPGASLCIEIPLTSLTPCPPRIP